jgi:hypothetical protein
LAMFSSYQKQALTVMISPLCTNCHDIAVILLNVALNTINLIFYVTFFRVHDVIRNFILPYFFQTATFEMQRNLFSAYVTSFSAYHFPVYNTYQEMAIWKSIVTLTYRELLALGRKIDIFECGIKHHQPNLLFTKTYTYLPIYLHFYENYRFYSILFLEQ